MPYLNKDRITGIIGSNCRNCNMYHQISNYTSSGGSLGQIAEIAVCTTKFQIIPMVGPLGQIAEIAMCTTKFQIIRVTGPLGQNAEIAMCTIGGPDCPKLQIRPTRPNQFLLKKRVFPK